MPAAAIQTRLFGPYYTFSICKLLGPPGSKSAPLLGLMDAKLETIPVGGKVLFSPAISDITKCLIRRVPGSKTQGCKPMLGRQASSWRRMPHVFYPRPGIGRIVGKTMTSSSICYASNELAADVAKLGIAYIKLVLLRQVEASAVTQPSY